MKKIASYLLATLLCVLSITCTFSCSNNDKPSVIDTDITTATQTTAPVEDTREPLNLTYTDYDGYEFKVIARYDPLHWKTEDVYSETQNGEPINDAVFKRNSKVSEDFDISISLYESQNLLGDCRKATKTADDVYGAYLTALTDNASLASEKCIVDLYNVPNINVTKPWWDSRSAEDFSIGGKLYGAMGDINITDNKATWVVLFNKKLASDNNLDNHYDLVNNGNWTLEKMHNNCLVVTNDINGDQSYTPEDQWGAVNQYECMRALFSASGGYSVMKDNNGVPYLTMGDENMVSLLDNILSFETDSMAQIKADDYGGQYNDVWTEVNVNTFLEGRALYYISPLTSLSSLREMEDEMGILILPKNDEKQSEYYTTLQYNNATCYSIPTTVLNLDRSGAILEALAYESDTLTEAYYEITLKRKYTNDNESADMLDLVFKSRIVDLGMMFEWGGLTSIYQDLPKATKNFASQYASKEKSITKAMEKTLTAFGLNKE